MGTPWRLCTECFEKSRAARGWWCPHCDYLKPQLRATPLPINEIVEVKPRKVHPTVAAKAQRKAEADSIAQAIAKVDRNKLPDVISGLRLKAGLRREPCK